MDPSAETSMPMTEVRSRKAVQSGVALGLAASHLYSVDVKLPRETRDATVTELISLNVKKKGWRGGEDGWIPKISHKGTDFMTCCG